METGTVNVAVNVCKDSHYREVQLVGWEDSREK